jgi:inner membrane protein involved in colicin E2 resistance
MSLKEKLMYSLLLKPGLIALVILVLLIPLSLIRSVITERSMQRNQAVIARRIWMITLHLAILAAANASEEIDHD